MDEEEYEFESDAEEQPVAEEVEHAFVPPTQAPPSESEHSASVRDWARLHGEDEASVRVVSQTSEDGCLVLELWGTELQVYLPEDEGADFFVTTEADDAKLNSSLTELNDMRQIRTLPQLLTAATELLRKHKAAASSPPGPATAGVLELAERQLPACGMELARKKSSMVLDMERLDDLQQEIIYRVAAVAGIETPIAELLLLHLRWDDEAVLRQLAEDRTALLVSAGAALPPSPAHASQHEAVLQKQRSTLCAACFAEEPTSCLPCGHGLCRECWPRFLRCNLDSGTVGGDNCLRLRCPGDRCTLLVPSRIFQEFLDLANFKRYRRLQVLSLANDNPNIAWCPADNCDLCVAFPQTLSTVKCTCGHSFCFSCKIPAHAPAKCSDAKAWLAKKEEMSGVASLKSASGDNKPCPNPKCGVLSNKESGCHYLICSRCREKWCWQCGDWGGGPSGRPEPHHVYDCNNPANQEWYKATSSVNVFDNHGKYWFYYERHTNHLGSLKFAEKLHEDVSRMVHDIQTNARFGIQDIHLVRSAAELLMECRLVLAWTYVWAFFETRQVQLRLFEFLQKDLETKTEQLSDMIEGHPTDKVLADRGRLLDYVAALRGYLDHIKEYSNVVPVEASVEAEDAGPPTKVAKRRRRT